MSGHQVDRFAQAGLEPSPWEAAPGTMFGEHAHPRAKLLTCQAGSIRSACGWSVCGPLHPGDEVVELREGDWIELPAGQAHSAVAGPGGVRCAEAFHD